MPKHIDLGTTGKVGQRYTALERQYRAELQALAKVGKSRPLRDAEIDREAELKRLFQEVQEETSRLRESSLGDFRNTTRRIETWTRQLRGRSVRRACDSISAAADEINDFQRAVGSNLYSLSDTHRARMALTAFQEAFEYNRDKCEDTQESVDPRAERMERREYEGLGLAARGRGMCDAYLDWLNSLQPRELLIATSRPNVFSCTDEGVQRWLEKKKRQEEQAQRALAQMRQEQTQRQAQLQAQRMSCHQPPSWVLDRIRDNPQHTTQLGPHAPLAVPFTPEEIRSAVLKILRGSDQWLGQMGFAVALGARPPSGCARGVSAADTRIADFVAKHLRMHHVGRGWIKITVPYAPGGRGGRVRYVDLPRQVEMMFGNGGVHSPGSEQGARTSGSYFDMDNFNTTFMTQLRLQRMPPYLREYGRPTFTPPTAQQRARVSEAGQVAALERQLRMLQLGPEAGAAGRDIRPRSRSEQLRMRIAEIERERFGAAPARDQVPYGIYGQPERYVAPPARDELPRAYEQLSRYRRAPEPDAMMRGAYGQPPTWLAPEPDESEFDDSGWAPAVVLRQEGRRKETSKR